MGQLATQSIPLPFTDFHGGLNTRDQPYLLTADQARDLNNLQGTAAGALVKRTGLQTLATPAVTFTSLYAAESLSPSQLLGAGATSLYGITSLGVVTAIKTGLTNNVPWEFVSGPVVSGQGPIYGMNGTDTPQQWAGGAGTTAWTNASGGVAVPNGKYCIYTQNQVFVTGVAAQPSRVYWSAIADPTNWDPASLTGAGFMDFDPNDGESITGIGVVGPYILVGKQSKLWMITNVAAAQARKISSNVGVTSHRSIAVGPTGTFFLSDDRGVYLTTGTKLTPVSDLLTPTFAGIQQGLRQQACGAYYNAHYYLSLPLTSSTNDTTLDFDEQLGSWWKHTFASNQFAKWHQPLVPNLYSAKSTAAFVDQCFVPGLYTDNGSNFQWVYRGPWQSPVFYRHKWYQTPHYTKRFRQIRVDGYGTVDLSTALNFAGSETLRQANIFSSSAGTFGASDGSVYGASDGTTFGSPSIQRARFHSFGVANAISVVLSATSGSPDAVTSYILMVVGRRDQVVQ